MMEWGLVHIIVWVNVNIKFVFVRCDTSSTTLKLHVCMGGSTFKQGTKVDQNPFKMSRQPAPKCPLWCSFLILLQNARLELASTIR